MVLLLFQVDTGLYSSYENINPLKPELRKFLPEYDKRIEFFKKCGGLHQYISEQGGNLNEAVRNSLLSMKNHDNDSSGAYSDMAMLFNSLLK